VIRIIFTHCIGTYLKVKIMIIAITVIGTISYYYNL